MYSLYGWTPIADVYDPLKVGSIDATDTEPHDHGIIRALNTVYKPNKGVHGDPERTIFVARLNYTTDENQLESLFSKCGKVEKCRVVRDIVTGFSKGYAFVEFSNKQDAKMAIHQLNHKYIDDRKIIVMFECERKMSGWIPRRLGGGFGGRKESGQLRFGGVERPFKKPIIVPENLRIKEIFPDESNHIVENQCNINKQFDNKEMSHSSKVQKSPERTKRKASEDKYDKFNKLRHIHHSESHRSRDDSRKRWRSPSRSSSKHSHSRERSNFGWNRQREDYSKSNFHRHRKDDRSGSHEKNLMKGRHSDRHNDRFSFSDYNRHREKNVCRDNYDCKKKVISQLS